MEKKKRKGWKIILLVVAILIVALLAAGFVFVKNYLNRIDRTSGDVVDVINPEDEFFDADVTPPASQPVPTEEPVDDPVQTGEPTPGTEPDDPEDAPQVSGIPEIAPEDIDWGFIERIEDDHLINILLVGQDRREGQGRQRSDSMILCSINPKTGEVSLISFLRDLYVQIPDGYSDNRLNAPFVFGGFELLDRTLSTNFGVSIDGNIEVDFSGFESIIDMLGGVDVYLSAAEAEYARRIWNADAVEGINHFNGHFALTYARIRKIDSDFGRTNRQREVLLAIYDKVKTLSVGELLDLMYEGLSYITTDLTDGQIISLAYRLLPLLSSMEIETYAVPGSNAYTRAYVNGMDVLLPNLQVIRDQLANEYLPLN